MKKASKWILVSSSVGALACAGMATPVAAQSTGSQDTSSQDVSNSEFDDSNAIVVTGIRESFRQALEVKRESPQVVESVVAEDVGKLPDNNVIEALQRLSGVQVTNRGAGETSGLSIRGLPDALTTWNGRKIFTASGTSFALQDMPANLVKRVDVYKTRSAGQIETGLAGQIDVQTRRPFDFDGFAISAVARGIYDETSDEVNPNVSALISDRWDTDAGEFGALLNISYSRTKYRDMSITAGAVIPFVTENPPAGTGYDPLQRVFPESGAWQPGLETGLPYTPGSTFNLNGVETPYYLSRDAVFANDVHGKRERPAINAALQWSPNPDATYTFEFFYNGYRSTTMNSMHFSFADQWKALGANPGNTFELYDGTNVIKSRTVGNAFGFNSGDYSTGKTDSYVYALNGDWKFADERGHITADLSFQDSKYETDFLAARLNREADQISVDFNNGGGLPGWSFGDNSLLTDPAAWTLAEFYDNANSSHGKAYTFQLDGSYDFDGGLLKTVRFGARADRRKAADSVRAQDAPVLGQSLSTLSDDAYYFTDGFYNGRADVPEDWINVSGYWLHDNADAMRELYRDNVDPGLVMGDNLSQLEVFNINEDTLAAYAEADFEKYIGDVRLFLQTGVRFVSVDTSSVFTDRYSGDTSLAATKTDKWLPSATFIVDPTDNLRFRFNFGRTLRRPAFADLNPNFNLTGDLTNIGRGTGTSGNSDLNPTISTNYDFSIEWYFQPGNAIYATAFRREIDGLVVPITSLFQIPNTGLNTDMFTITRPENASDGVLKGVELGFIYFPELPGILDGLGAQGSMTILDSSQTIPQTNQDGEIVSETTSEFFGVSDVSYNITAAYDRGPIGLRLSYVWRKNFLDANEARLFANPLGIWRKPEKSLDFQLTYSLTDNLGVTFDAVNITNEKQQSYYRFGEYGGPDLYNFGSTLLNRTFALGIRYSFD
ncbi:TonB-dependent receptor [Altericroceibacterium spongiae]|uniref:TonB-dependent receptor n=1 Tax=Altericroceibacterium spongiae TaxID=2320269 RepID=A0A420EAE0_9SPHN|nr:TonB-dependent receptor [Altericroceibacterium spongiae]RKF17646.1 TonB-dependent receptor [Altericroceibacterium spongiae]